MAKCEHSWVYNGGSCCNRRLKCIKCDVSTKVSRIVGDFFPEEGDPMKLNEKDDTAEKIGSAIPLREERRARC